eukprot:TRINITY_DN14140_c0_g1_i1.p1 TRINITY_DN14140_c0_g1~~TRINITY_DN14140_c0_g1_i1.p1  ORF type:complete len:254 (-),score=37.38 TRINITY_DN14140_c0_g1_i1:156-887(-)
MEHSTPRSILDCILWLLSRYKRSPKAIWEVTKNNKTNEKLLELMECMALALFTAIRPNEISAPSVWLPQNVPTQSPPINKEAVLAVLVDIFVSGDISEEIGVIAFIYIDRLLAKVPDLCLDVLNWKKLTLSAFILASKVWDDATIWNEDFLAALPLVTVKELANCEHQLLKKLDWDVLVTTSTYASYHLALLSLKNISYNPSRSEGKCTKNEVPSMKRKRSQSFAPPILGAALVATGSFETEW